VADLDGATVEVLVSDRPFFALTGMDALNFTLFLPIGPRHIFFATRSLDARKSIEAAGASRIARACNVNMVTQADQFVYGRAKTEFVRRYLRAPREQDHRDE